MITLIPADTKDLEFMRKLRNENKHYFFREGYITKKMHKVWWEDWVKNKRGSFCILNLNGEDIGTISITATKEGWELGNVIIIEKYRKRGYLRDTIETLKAIYGNALFLRVKGSNKDAIAAYSKIGFKIRSLTMEL